MAETATINGTELAYIDHGRGQPVVFVHGGVGDYRAWDLQMPAFAASFRTIALSCRGAWPNRKLEPDEEITLDTFVEDLASFIKELDLAPVHLVGHSSPGGFGGLLLADRYPEPRRAAGGDDTRSHAPGTISIDSSTARRLRAHHQRAVRAAAEHGTALAARAFVCSEATDGSTPYRPDKATGTFRRVARRTGLPAARLHDLRHLAATRMIAADVDVRTVAGRLGHGQTVDHP